MNPVVQKLFEDVENPILRACALQAIRLRETINVDYVPDELAEPLFILDAAAREMKGREIVDRPRYLRDKLNEKGFHHRLTEALLDGAGFNAEPRKYPDAAKMNCEPGEVRLCYLSDGQHFRMGQRQGQLIYRTPSCAVIEIAGGPKQKTFRSHQAGGVEGEEVTITTSGMQRTRCALETPVTPIHATVNHEDRVWAINAWKEITGVFEEETPAVETKKGKSKR